LADGDRDREQVVDVVLEGVEEFPFLRAQVREELPVCLTVAVYESGIDPAR
jgi:hypothetical protein